MRTVQAAKGKTVPMANLQKAPLLSMSQEVRQIRSWFYPASVTTAAQAHTFLEAQVKQTCLCLGVPVPERITHALEVMSTGDEACLMCEGSHCANFSSRDVQLMEEAVRSGLHDTWRTNCTFTGEATRRWTITETEQSGVFVGPVRALAALRQAVQTRRKRKRKAEPARVDKVNNKRQRDKAAYTPPRSFALPSAAQQMQFISTRPTSRGAAVECMQRLGCLGS